MSNPASTTTPIGTGAFKLTEWKRGEFLRFARNDKYWMPGKPYLDEVLVRPVPQASSRTQALQAGEVDFIPYFFLAGNDVPILRQNPEIVVTPAKVPPTQDMLFLNVRRKPLDDKRVRQALMMATDRAFFIKNGWLGFGKVAIAPFNTQLKWAVNPDIDYNKMYPFDPAKANALLDEAGVKRGSDGIRFNFDLVFVSDEVDLPRVALAIKQMWAAIGVNVKINGLDRPTSDKRTFSDLDFDGALNGYTSFGDPALGLARIFVTSSIGKVYGNLSGYSRPDVDQLFSQAEIGFTEKERGAVYSKLQSILAEDLPVLTIRERIAYDASSTKIEGAAPDPYLPTWKYEWMKK